MPSALVTTACVASKPSGSTGGDVATGVVDDGVVDDGVVDDGDEEEPVESIATESSSIPTGTVTGVETTPGTVVASPEPSASDPVPDAHAVRSSRPNHADRISAGYGGVDPT